MWVNIQSELDTTLLSKSKMEPTESSAMKTKIIIVEDEALIAAEITSTLILLGYQVVGHAMNGDRALDLFASQETDLYLLDISIKGTKTGIDLAKVIRAKYHRPFIFLTSFSDRLTLDQAKTTNPYGYIVKPFNENDLKVNIELALHKFKQENDAAEFNQSFAEQKLGVLLSDREYTVLKSFYEGKTYKETGEALYISTNTVKTYQKKIFSLCNVSSRYDLLKKLE